MEPCSGVTPGQGFSFCRLWRPCSFLPRRICNPPLRCKWHVKTDGWKTWRRIANPPRQMLHPVCREIFSYLSVFHTAGISLLKFIYGGQIREYVPTNWMKLANKGNVTFLLWFPGYTLFIICPGCIYNISRPLSPFLQHHTLLFPEPSGVCLDKSGACLCRALRHLCEV